MVKINSIISLLAVSSLSLVAAMPATSFNSRYESDYCKELDAYLNSKNASLNICSIEDTDDSSSLLLIKANTITQDIVDKINTFEGNLGAIFFENISTIQKNLNLGSLKTNALYFDNKHYNGEKKEIYIPRNVLKTAKTLTTLSIYGLNLSQKNINEISSLTKLTELYFESCTADLDMDYSKLKNLKNLKTLVLSTMFQKGQGTDRMDEVPESICQLKKLTYLCLYRNDISYLPKCMKNLKNLEKLDLALTDLTSDDIPRALKRLPNLKISFE